MAVRSNGRFITLEGGEGAGKSTQAKRLAGWLEREVGPVVLTREPGGSARSELLRELLLSGRVARFGPEAEAYVFAVSRADHIAETIRPALEAGKWVVCDRFLDSTWAYQGAAGLSAEFLANLDEIAVGETRPDITLVLDLPVETGLARMRGRSGSADRFEADAIAVHEARRAAFLQIAAREPQRCIVIDASMIADEVTEAIRAAVTERLVPGTA